MKYSIALSLVPRVGSKHMRQLLAAFGSAEAVIHAEIPQLTAAGASIAMAREITSGQYLARAESIIDQCARSGIRILTPGRTDLPRAFAEGPDAPCIL